MAGQDSFEYGRASAIKYLGSGSSSLMGLSQNATLSQHASSSVASTQASSWSRAANSYRQVTCIAYFSFFTCTLQFSLLYQLCFQIDLGFVDYLPFGISLFTVYFLFDWP